MSPPPARINPFPGLRPFTQDEDYLFFGREEQTIELLQRLGSNRFVAVVGTSGSGKSSLVRCGLLSELLGGRMLDAGASWEIAVTHPGGNPLALLTDALLEADLYDRQAEHARENLLATLSRSHFGLVEAVKQAGLGEGTNFLLVVDQFEEIFRFNEAGQRQQEAANEFVSLMLESAAQKEVPIYIVLTMRSDFIGECGQFEGLAEMVNRGEFLIPRLTREQFKRVIEGPIKVAGGQIAPRLMQRLLNDLGQQADQLPCLQHALMRTWDVWSAKGDTEALDLDDYQRVGRMSQALSLHADEIYESLARDQRELCKGIFQALTVEESNNRGIRRPQRLGRLCQILEVPDDELRPIIDTFRQQHVTFLMPSPEVELTEQTIIDISHESLMRVWTRLRQWVEEETQAAGIYHRLSESADLHGQGKAGLYRDPELGIALAWQESKQPNAAWAERYRPGFTTAMGFLKASQQASVAEEQAREAARQRELEQAKRLAEAQQLRLEQQHRSAGKLRKLIAGLAVVAVLAGCACVFALVANNKANVLAKLASQEAENAKRNEAKAESAQKNTAAALTEVAAEKTRAEENLEKAEAAEKRSREFRYATDMQLAATLVADSTANAGQVLVRLSDHDPEENTNLVRKNDLRGFEWHYLKQLAGGRASIIKGFDKDVVDAVLSPEGELVTLTSDSRLQRWNAATRQETRLALDLKKGRTIGAQALSRDGRLAALAVGNEVSLVDAVTGQEQPRTLPAQTRGGLLFSPDGRMVITVDTGVGWWDAATGKPLAVQDFKLTHYPGSDNKTPVSVSADGLTLAVGGQGSYRGSFSVVRMNPQTREVTALANAAVETGTKRTLAISPDGQTVAVSYFFQGALSLYEVATGKLLHRESSAHSSSISSIAFNADGTEMATASLDGTIKVWKDFKTLDVAKATSLMGHSDQVVALAYSPGEPRLISAGQDKSVRLWDLEQNTSTLHRVIPGSGGLRARYSPDGMLMAIAGELQLQLRDGTTGQVLRQFPRRNDGVSSDSVAFSPDGRLLAAGFGGAKDVSLIELWDIDRRERIAELPGTTAIPGFATTEYTGIVGSLAFSPDGKHLVAGFGSLNLLSWGDRGNNPLLVYDVAAKRVVRRLEGHGNTCVSVEFSSDGTRMASASMDCTARIWDTANWQERHVLHNPDAQTDLGQRRVYDVAFSPDGKLLAMASAEGHVIVWNAETGEYQQTLHGHANEVWAVAFSPDGLTLASGSIDNTVRLWNVATWRELVRLDPKVPLENRSLAFSPDGSRLLSAGFRGGTVVWSVQPAGEHSGPKPDLLSLWLKTGADFQTRVRMHSENLRLFEPLEKLAQQFPDNATVQEALAANRANWHASRQEWKPAVEQFDRVRQLGAKSPDAWLSTPGRLRLATALLHEQRLAEAAALLTGGEKRRADDGDGTRVVAFGFEYSAQQYPLKLSRVYRGSPAWKAGLQAGDRLLKFNDVELTAKTAADYMKAATGGEGTKLRLTIQHSGQEQPEAVELTKVSHIQDDVTVEQIERLLAAVDGKLSDSPNHPGLLELRAELAGQSSESDRQVADFTAALTALESLEPQPTADVQRLRRRRGDTYVRLKQWQSASEDYAQGIAADTTDEELLANRASAQAEVLVAGRKESLENVWIEDAPPAGANLQGDTPWEIVGRPDHPVYSGEKSFRRQATGKSQHFFTDGKPGLKIVEGGVLFAYVYLDPQDPPKSVMFQFNDGQWEHRAYWGENLIDWGMPDTISRRSMGPLPKTGEWVRLEVPVEQVGLKPGAELNGWAFTQFAGTCYWDRAGITGSWGSTLETPWHKLAAAYRLLDDQPAIDQLVAQRPQMAGPIGDLFAQGVNQDWPRAVALYSRGITPDTTDFDLFAKRARAYEELKDWNAAAADWTRSVGENPERVKFLTEFATRLEKSEQRALADAQRQRARQVLEAALKGDPDDAPVADRLAEILLDLSEPKSPEWTTVTPAVSTTGGATLAVQDDRSIVVEQGQDIVTLPAAGRPVSAIRLETSPEAAPPTDGAAAFTEYRIVSTQTTSEGLQGRYVRIDLPGDNKLFPRADFDGDGKMLNLTEVQVFQGATNIAQGKPARQFGTFRDSFGDWEAARAVDGNTNAAPEARSTAHTTGDYRNPWWEVDLGDEQLLDRLVIWNRVSHLQRMNHFRVRVLNAERRVLYEEVINEAPNPSREIRLNSVQVAHLPSSAADDASSWQVRFNTQGEARPWKRFRLSTSEESPKFTADIDSSALKWSVLDPSHLTPAEGAVLAARADGSFVVESAVGGGLALPHRPDSVKALRMETTSASSSAQQESATFTEYRLEALNAPRSESGAPRGRYVRIDLPGDSQQFPRRQLAEPDRVKVVSLAEVQVFQGDDNLALTGTARQSSDHDSPTAGLSVAARAVDGNTDGRFPNRSVTHTKQLPNHDPWWEVDFGDERAIDRIVVWGRTESVQDRLRHVRVQLLDRHRQVIFEQMIDDAPKPSREIDCRSWLVAKTPEPDGDKPQWTLRLGRAAGQQRIRLATADQLPTREFDHDSSALAWAVVKPTGLKSTGGRAFTAHDDGSYLVETIATDTLPLPVLPETVKTVRIETAATSGAPPVFSEYRAQAVGAATTDSGALQGRFVRLDLPGQFPRRADEGDKKYINLAEFQVFQGDQNIALRKTARQSSSGGQARLEAAGAVDGNTVGNDAGNPYAHTWDAANPWWEVDLGSEQAIDRMVVWNRSDPNEMPRMNHFRVRVLDASRYVVFEQVIDAAPNPSREILCRSLLVKTASTAGDGPPQWSLRLDKATGIDPGRRFRISTAATADSLAREEAIAEARKISIPGARLAAAYDLNGQSAAAADWFGRALASVPTDHQRQPVLASLKEHPDALTELLRRQPDDRQLQLAQVRRLVQQGGKALSDQDTGRALASLQSARELYEAWLAHTPEQHWTVLTPVEMKAEHGSRLTLQPDGSVFVQQPAAKDTYTLVVPWDLKDVRGLRLEALADARLPKGGPGWAGNGNFHLKHLSLQATSADKSGPSRPITLKNAQADFTERGWDFRGIVTGRGKAGWSVLPEVNQNHTALFEIAEDVSDIRSTQLTIVLLCESEYDKHLLGRFRLSVTSDAATLPATRRRFDLKDSELTALDVALGKAYAQQKNATEAVATLTRALDRTPEEKDRKPLIEQFPQEAAVLTLLAQQHPQDVPLQLALAKRLAEDGKKALGENRQDEALPHLAQARELFSRLAVEHPDSTWTVLQPTEMTSEGGADLALEPDGSIFVSGNNPDRDTYTITAPLAGSGFTALRLEAIPDERLPGRGAGRVENTGEFVLAEIEVALKSGAGADRVLVINEGYADFSRDGYFVSQAFDSDPETQWNVLPRFTEPHFAVFMFDRQAESPAGLQNVVIRLKCGLSNYPRRSLGRFRLSVTSDANSIAAAKFHQDLKASGLAELERSLGNVHGRQARVADAAAAFQQALDLAADRDARLKILQEASAHAGVLDQLAALRPTDTAFLDLLARHFQKGGNVPNARVAAAKARDLYERRLVTEPSNAKLARDLADLLLDVSPVEFATRNWTILKPTEMKSTGGATLTVLEDGSILAGGNAANSEVYTITTKAGLANIQAFLLEAIPHESLPLGSSGRRPSDGDFALSEFKIAQSSDGRPGSLAAVPLTLAICDYSQPHSLVTNVLDGKDSTFWDILPHVQQPHFAAFAPAAPLMTPAEGVLTFTLEFKFGQPLGLGRFRLSATDNPEAMAVEKTRLAAVKIDNPWLRLGVAYRSLGEVDAALNQFARALELAGTDHAKGAVAQQAAAFDDLFARLLERFPEDKALRLGQAKHLAAMHAAANQFQTAVDVLSAVLGDFPDDLELRILRAGALMKLGRWPAADADYARVINLETDVGRRRAAERTRAEVQLRMGQFQAGAEAFLQEMLLTPDYSRLRDASVAELLAGNSATARTAALRLYEKSSSTKDASEARWQIHVFTSLPGLVTKDNSQKLLELAKTAGDTWTEPMTAAIHYRLGDLANAEPLLTTTRTEQEFQALGAMLLYDRGELDKARKLLDVATNWIKGERSKDPNSAIPIQQGWQNWVARVAVYREATRKLIGSRLKELDELLATEPDRTPELLERARLLADADLHDEALRDLDRLIALKVATSEAQALHGRILAGMNRDEEALLQLNLAIEAGSQDASVYSARGTLLLKRGESKQASADLEKSLKLEPTAPAARAMADLLLAGAAKSVAWTVIKPVEMKSARATLTLQDDGSILASGDNSPGQEYHLKLVTDLKTITALRLEALTDESLPKLGPGRGAGGNFSINWNLTGENRPGGTDPPTLQIKAAVADYAHSSFPITSSYWNIEGGHGRSHEAFLALETPQQNDTGSEIKLTIKGPTGGQWADQNLGRFRLSVTDDPAAFAYERNRFAALKLIDPWAKLGAAYALGGQPSDAAQVIAQALPRLPNAAVRAGLIEQAFVNRELRAALLESQPDDPQLQLAYAKWLASRGRWDEAAAAYQHAAKVDAEATPRWLQTGFWKAGLYPYGLEQVFPPESNSDPLRPVAAVAVPGQTEPAALPWQPVIPAGDGRIDFGTERGCNYALTRIFSPAEQEVSFQMGDDDRLRLFVNDRLLFQSNSSGGASQPKEHEVAVTLQAGWNTVLVKVENSSGPCNAYLAFSRDPQDLVVARVGTRAYAAQQLAAAGKAEAAVALLTDLIAESPKDVRVFAARADAYAKLSQWELALADWTSADLHAPDKSVKYGNPAFYCLEQRAHIFNRLKQYDKAVLEYTELLKPERHGKVTWALSGRAGAYDRLRQWELARADYDEVIKIAPTTDRGTNYLARARHSATQGQWKQAAEDVQQAWQNPSDRTKDWAAWRDAALIFAIAGDAANYKKAATELYSQQSAGNPSADQCRWTVLTMLLSPEMITNENRPRLLEMAAKSDNHWRPRLTAAACFRAGDYQQAADLFSANTGGTTSLFLRAMTELQLENKERAQKLLEEGNAWIRSQQAKDPGAGVPLSTSWQDWISAVVLQSEASDSIFGPAVGPQKLALAGDTFRAANAYAKALTEAPDQDARSRIIDELAQFDDVVTTLFLRFPKDPAIAEAYRRVVQRLAADYNQQLAVLDGKTGDNTAARSKLVATILARGDGVLESLLQLRPEDTQLATLHAVRSGDWKSAAAGYSKLTEQNPKADSVAWMIPTTLWAYAGEPERHRELCQKMYERYRDSTVANDAGRYLKVLLLVKNEAELPQDVVKKFYDSAGTYGNWYRTIVALVEFRKGDDAEAHKQIDEALAQESKSPDPYIKAMALAIRGLTYARQQDVPQARKTLDVLKQFMASDLKVKWHADGFVDSSTILNGVTVDHNKLAPEIIRREAENLIQSAADSPNPKTPAN